MCDTTTNAVHVDVEAQEPDSKVTLLFTLECSDLYLPNIESLMLYRLQVAMALAKELCRPTDPDQQEERDIERPAV
jgi:hypothetical protein